MEKYISLSEAAALAPGRPHVASIWRWCRKGVTSRSGERIKLIHIRAGSRLFTTEENLQTFFEQIAEADAGHFDPLPDPPPRPTDRPRPQCRERSRERAETILKSAGILR